MTRSSASRPLLLRYGPPWLRERLARRLYLRRVDHYKELFEGAELLLAPGIKLDLLPSDVCHAVIALTGSYEFEVASRLVALAREGGAFVDVGANYGYYTCLWLSGKSTNMAVAVEASPRNIGALAANIRKNHLDGRVVVSELALSKEDGRIGFWEGPPEQSGWGGLVGTGREADLEVESRRLDTLLYGLGWTVVDALKIDVEGADGWVLEGAEGLLRSHRIRHIFFEDNAPRARELGILPGAAQSLLSGFGYALERLTATEWYATVPGEANVEKC